MSPLQEVHNSTGHLGRKKNWGGRMRISNIENERRTEGSGVFSWSRSSGWGPCGGIGVGESKDERSRLQWGRRVGEREGDRSRLRWGREYLGESEGDRSKNTYCEWISAPRSTEKNYITDKGIVHRYSTVGTINSRQIQRHKNQYIEYPYTWETVPIWLLTGSPQIQVDSSTTESY